MELNPSRKNNFLRLQKWLDFELKSSVLLPLAWLFPLLLLSVWAITAVIFTPLMLKILYQEKKYNWLIWFVIIVVVPALIIYIPDYTLLYKSLLGYIPLIAFLFYFFALKQSVRKWLTEYRFIKNEQNVNFDPNEVFKNDRF